MTDKIQRYPTHPPTGQKLFQFIFPMVLSSTYFLFFVAISLFQQSTKSTRLLFTYEGGPYTSLAAGEEKGIVLFGDKVDRGFRCNAKDNHVLNIFEAKTKSVSVTGMAEHPETKSVITAHNNGHLLIWDYESNKTKSKFEKIVPPGTNFTDLLITHNDLIIASANHDKNNIFFMPFYELNVTNFTRLDNNHTMPVTRVRKVHLAPMFITLSGGNFTGNKLFRWSSTNPPRLLAEYSGHRVKDFDACWGANRLILGTYGSSLIQYRLTDSAPLSSKMNVFKSPVQGVAFVPFVNFIVAGGDKVLKIYDLEFKLKETVEDSLDDITGQLFYERNVNVIAGLVKGGAYFWNQCNITNCQACLNETNCHTCRIGFGRVPLANGSTCVPYGTRKHPIDWDVKVLNIDRTKFRLMFKDTHGPMFDTINTIPDLKDFVRIRSRTDVSASDAFGVDYVRRPELRSWDIELQYKRSNPYTGYISFMIKNNTKGRLLGQGNYKKQGIHLDNFEDMQLQKVGIESLEDLELEEYPYKKKPKAKRILEREKRMLLDLKTMFFNPGPKFISSPSMPAFRYSVYGFYRVLGVLYRLIYWACILIMWFDVYTRFVKNRRLQAMPLIRYCFVYFGITFIGLFQLNNRPVYTQSNRGLHHSIMRRHIILGEFALNGSNKDNAKYLGKKGKYSDYGTNLILCDRFLLELILYFSIILASFIIKEKKKFYLIKAIRFPFILAIGINVLISCFYMVYNRWWGASQSFYTKFCSVVAIVLFVFIGFELFIFIISSMFLLNETEEAKLNNGDSYSPEYMKNELGDTKHPELIKSQILDAKENKNGRMVPSKNNTPDKKSENPRLRQSSHSKSSSKSNRRSAMGTFFVDASNIFNRVKTSILKKRNSTQSSPSNNRNEAQNRREERVQFDKNTKEQKKLSKGPNSKILGIKKSRFNVTRTGSITVERTNNFLRTTFIAHEMGGSYMKRGFEKKALCCFYLPAMFIRFTYIAYIIIFKDDNPQGQCINFLILNVIFLLITLGCSKYLMYKGLKLTQELLWIIWSILLICNALDDKQPEWDLGVFWLIMLGSMLCRFIIMVIEIFYLVMTLKDVFPRVMQIWTGNSPQKSTPGSKLPPTINTKNDIKKSSLPPKPQSPQVNSTYIQKSKHKKFNKKLFDEEGNSYYLETEERGLVPGEIIDHHLIKKSEKPPYSPFKQNPHLIDDAPKYTRPPQPHKVVPPPKPESPDIPTAQKMPPLPRQPPQNVVPQRETPQPPPPPPPKPQQPPLLVPDNIPYSPVRVHPISPLPKQTNNIYDSLTPNKQHPSPGYKIPYDQPTPTRNNPPPKDDPQPPRKSKPSSRNHNPFSLPRRLDHITQPQNPYTPQRNFAPPVQRPSKEVDKQNPFLNRHDSQEPTRPVKQIGRPDNGLGQFQKYQFIQVFIYLNFQNKIQLYTFDLSDKYILLASSPSYLMGKLRLF